MDGGHVAGAPQGGRGEGEVGGASAGGNGADGGVGGGAVASGQPRLRQSSALAGAKGVEWTLTRTDPLTVMLPPLLLRFLSAIFQTLHLSLFASSFRQKWDDLEFSQYAFLQTPQRFLTFHFWRKRAIP